MEPILHTCGPIPPPQLHLNLWVSADIIYLLLLHLNLRYYSAFLPHLNLGLSFSADIPLLSGIHIKQLSPTFTWHSFRRLSSHLYLARILSLPFHLYMTPFFIFSADIIPPLSVALLLYLSPPLSGTFSSHLTLAPAPRRAFFTPTFTCNLYSPSAFILFHLNVTLPQGFSAEYFYPP